MIKFKLRSKTKPALKIISWLLIITVFILGCVGMIYGILNGNQPVIDEEYEAKKAAYRNAIMADDVTNDDFLIGSWVSFYSFDIDSYEYQLDQMAAAGINFNMYPYIFNDTNMYNLAHWNYVEEQYAKRNMVYQMIGKLHDKNINIVSAYAAGKEHCVGYHVMDEPSVSQFSLVAYSVKSHRKADPSRYPFVNLFPDTGDYRIGGTYREYVSRFVEVCGAENIEYLSHDHYPFRSRGTDLGIFADMEVIRSVAYENGKLKTHAFPQASAWSGTRMPNINEMRWNVYGYLAYGFKALSWFNLVCPGNNDTEGEGYYDSLIYRDGTIRNPELFAAWSDLNWEIRGFSSVLMNLDTVHAYHVKKNVEGVEYLPDDYFLQPTGLFNANDFIISVMEPKEGNDQYIMIFNKSTTNSVTCDFKVDSSAGVKYLEYFDPLTGEYTPVEFKNGHLKDSFIAGEGKLYRLCYV